MHRAAAIAAIVALAAPACSSTGDDEGDVAAAGSDPVLTFCSDWQRFDTLTNSDREPNPALVQEVIGLQDEMGGILPAGLEAEWASILEWNETFIDHFETAGYDDLSEAAFVDLFGGEAALEVAGEAREDGYDGIAAWSRQHCPDGGGVQFCDLWPAYDELLESDIEPTEELVGRLLDMQAEIDQALPSELTTAWAGIVDWNQAFIDVFEQVGYGPVTEQTFEQAFGGDDEAAGAAQQSIEDGLATIRDWTAQNCAAEDNFEFCSALSELTALTGDEDALTAESYEEALAAVDRVGTDVPAEVRGDWDAVVESVRGFHDLLISVNFEPRRITDDLLEQAFGSVEAAIATEEAADAGLAALDEWSLTGCGDFCARWPDFRRALDETTHDLGWVREGEEFESDGSNGRLDEHLRALDIGSRLVPDEIQEIWHTEVAARRDWISWWESFEYDGDQSWSDRAREQALVLLRQASYLTDVDDYLHVHYIPLGIDQRRVIAAWQDGIDRAPAWVAGAGEFDGRATAEWLDGSGEPPDWLVEFWHWGPGGWFDGQLTAAIDGWVEDNCEAVTGRPGTVKVTYPRVEGKAGDTLILGLLPHGGSVQDLASPSTLLGGWCEGVHSDPWGRWFEGGHEHRHESGEFHDERWPENALCGWDGVEPAIFDAGTYTMVAAVVEGGWPRSDAPLPLATCLAFDVLVDGETKIDVPDLPPCDVDLGDTDDPWRNPPAVDPSTPGAGTLQIVFPDLVADGQGGEVLVVVLPAGTTLNEVGREQVWPVGATRTSMLEWHHEEEEQHRHIGEVIVPVAALPASGSPRSLNSHWLVERPPADRLPLAVLAPGAYDVHVQLALHDPPELDSEESNENDGCVSFEVTVAGDTVVDLPELGECPRIW